MIRQDKYDLVVVGGGVLGTFCAFHALNLGLSVALIERNKLPREATVRNFGQIVPSGLAENWRGYGRKSLGIYKSLQAIGDFTVRNQGSMYIASCDDEMTLLAEMADINRQGNVHSIALSAKSACSALPGLKGSYCKGALYYPDEVSVDPRQMIHRVIEYMTNEWDLSYLPYTIAQAIEAFGEHGCRITTNTQQILFAEQVIICAGTEYQLLFPEEYQNDEISCVKIHMLMTAAQPTQRIPGNVLTGLSIRRYEAFKECASYSEIIAKDDQDPRVRQWGIHLLFKQTDNGQIIIGDSHHYADAHDKEELGFDIDQEVNSYILEKAREIFDLETYSISAMWTGIYSQTKNTDIISKTLDGRVHILNAIGGKGMTAGPGYTFYYIHKLFGHD